MQSGRETLATLDTAIRSLRNEIDRVDSELTMATQSLARNRQQQTQTTRAIAEVRLDGIASGEVRQACLLYTSPSPRDKRQSRMPSSA